MAVAVKRKGVPQYYSWLFLDHNAYIGRPHVAKSVGEQNSGLDRLNASSARYPSRLCHSFSSLAIVSIQTHLVYFNYKITVGSFLLAVCEKNDEERKQVLLVTQRNATADLRRRLNLKAAERNARNAKLKS